MRIKPFGCLALTVALAVLPAKAHAQDLARDSAKAATGNTIEIARRNLLIVNPFGIVFNIVNGEYEHVLSKSASIGLGGSYYGPSDYNYFTTEVKARYYPSERAPDGFSLALSGGITRETGALVCFDSCNTNTENRPTLGFELDYNWLLGPTRRFVIGTGLGAKRFFGSKTSGSIDGLPTARLAIGVAF